MAVRVGEMGRSVDLDLAGVDLPVGDGFRRHGRPVRDRDGEALRGREAFRIAGGGGDRGRPAATAVIVSVVPLTVTAAVDGAAESAV